MSDLEQMPSLLNFIKGGGTLLSNHHTILIAHTAGGILSSMTGLYPDRNGIAVSNSYDYFRPNLTPAFTSAFKYWNDPVDAVNDPLPNMVNGDTGTPRITPAPWVPFTRAGCDFGAVSAANIVLENTSTSSAGGDIFTVFGPGSPEFLEASSPDAATRARAFTDFVGIAIHCGVGTSCNTAAGARPDKLPDEVGGYTANALFGAKYVNPAICSGSSAVCANLGGSPAVTDLNGFPIKDTAGNPGFPGFDAMSAAVSLAYIAQMQEAGVPVTFGYISDAHDNHAGLGAYGPGEAGYVQELKAYDNAFEDFFARLGSHGINGSNTLFVFTVDEGDHFSGQIAGNCNGVTSPCTYQHKLVPLSNGAATGAAWTPPAWPPSFDATGAPVDPAKPLVGEIGVNMSWLFPEDPATYDISFDSAPSFYINGRLSALGPNGQLALNTTLRRFEREAASAKAFDPFIDPSHLIPVANSLADAPQLKALHMINADPNRTPSFTMFAKPDFFFQKGATFRYLTGTCSNACLNPAFAWIHGDDAPDIANNWLGIVGPGVRNEGEDRETWTDHVDVRPTILSLVGLQDTYVSDGRVLTEILDQNVQPKRLRGHEVTLEEFVRNYKQINAPFGQFAMDSLKVSTAALSSNSASDAVYLSLENKIIGWTALRDEIATQMKEILDGAAFHDQHFNEVDGKKLNSRVRGLLEEVGHCAADPASCVQ